MGENKEHKWEHAGSSSLAFEWAMAGDLSNDYRGRWTPIQGALNLYKMAERNGDEEDKAEALDLLNVHRPTFEEYVRDEFPPDQQEQILVSPNLDWEQIKKINALAEEYNALADVKGITPEMAENFKTRSEGILRKK